MMNTRGGRRSPSLSPPSKKTSKRKFEESKNNAKNGDRSPDRKHRQPAAADSDDSQSESGQSSTSRMSNTSKKRGQHVQSLGFGSSSSFVDIPQSPSKRSKANSQAPADTEMERKWYSTIKSVLTKHYFDVVGRLLLDFQPGCLSNLEYCAQFHSRNGDLPNEIDEYLVKDARTFISEDRPQVFLKFVSKLSISNDFPGTKLVLSLLELILTVNRPSHNHYTAPFIIETAQLLFENIITNFPACWLDVRDSYKKLLTDRLHIDLPKNKYDVNGGIVKVALVMLETVLQEENVEEGAMNESNVSTEGDDFYTWEKKNQQRYLFESLPRDDKLDRIFQVLNLLVKLMECDLAIWIIRHPKNTSVTMSKPKKMPLIGYFLWPAEECGQINNRVKQILNLFVVCIHIGVPDDKVDILARFVNLVSNAINLCELQPKGGEIRFPNIQSHTEIFALEVKKTIEKVQTCNVDLFLAVIDHIKAPFIKIIAIDQLLMKFNRDVGRPSMKKLHQNFVKKRWTECDEEGSRKLFTHIPDEFNLSRYPVYRPLTQKKRTSDIYQTDYLHLLLSSFKSYQILYKVDTICDLLQAAGGDVSSNGEGPSSKSTSPTPGASTAMTTTTSADSASMTADEYEAFTRKVNKQRQDKFNFLEMEKAIKKLERIAETSATLDVVYHAPIDFTTMMDDIVVDSEVVLRYREDAKHYVLLCELIEEYFVDYGKIFTPWHEAVRRSGRSRIN